MFEVGELVRRLVDKDGQRFHERLGIIVGAHRQLEGWDCLTIEVDWGDGYVLRTPLHWIEKCAPVTREKNV